MRAARPTFGVLAALAMASAAAQMTYPDCYIQNVDWTSGTHYIGVPQPVIAPGYASMPTSVSGTAEAELVSGTQVRLTPGFHAGDLNGSGRFRARIDQNFGSPDDIVVITPDPTTHVEDDILHVEKWEKLEIGFRLPQEYQDAIESFFAHYYPYPDDPGDPTDDKDPWISAPSNTDEAHDLNPYADDSLQLVMTLTDPSGDQRMKWGFYMREAMWETNPFEPGLARLTHNETSALDASRARFRFAPDEEGAWQFALSITAPLTTTPGDDPLAQVSFSGFGFICDPPMEDNKGPLSVNNANGRTLVFEGEDTDGDETPFFALGVNMAGGRHGYMDASIQNLPGDWWYTYYERDFDAMQLAMAQLHEAGGNFMRIFLTDKALAPELVNLGVYDAYKIPFVCDLPETEPTVDANCDRGWTTDYTGNCQYQCWAFDQLLEQARAKNIYLQLCIDPYPPIIAYEKMSWGAHPYAIHFLDPNRQAPPLNPYNMREFFYRDGEPSNQEDRSIFYYWKRKYKYIMSRWGYSVNLPIIEPFNEINQMLSYGPLTNGTLGNTNPVASCSLSNDQNIPHRDICRENRGSWSVDSGLPAVISNWLTDIIDFVRDDAVDFNDPVHSPLGEKKLFLMSYTDGQPASNTAHYLPFTNPKVDLIDMHRGFPTSSTEHEKRMSQGYDDVASFVAMYSKPFNHGEYQHYTSMAFGSWQNDIEKIFHNYDVSFHNEIWASAFSGKFAAGTTWHWERVFWWEDALPVPPTDGNDVFQPNGTFSNARDAMSLLDIGIGVGVSVTNRTIHHNFKPLADLLSNPIWSSEEFFNGEYTAHRVYDESPVFTNRLESYYLKNTAKTTAVGWVHNRRATVMNSYYLASGSQHENFLGCSPPQAPWSNSILLHQFLPETEYHVAWFPTRMNSTTLPPEPDPPLQSTIGGALEIPLPGQFGGVANNYLDTLRSDYAFIISTEPFVKSLRASAEEEVIPGWDFTLYPNPTRDELYVVLPDDAPKDIVLHDPAGRQINAWFSVTGPMQRLPIQHLAQGVYYVKVVDGVESKTRKLIIH